MSSKRTIVKGILKTSESTSPCSRRGIVWDEENVSQCEHDRIQRMQTAPHPLITEPKTPWLRSIPLSEYTSSEYEDEDSEDTLSATPNSSTMPSSASKSFHLSPAAMNYDPLQRAMVSSGTDNEDENEGLERDREAGNGNHGDGMEVGEREFRKRRESHYHNMKESIEMGKALLKDSDC